MISIILELAVATCRILDIVPSLGGTDIFFGFILFYLVVTLLS